MATAAILDFKNFECFMKLSNFCHFWYMQLKLQPHVSIHAEVIYILANSRWRPPPSWIFKISQFWWNIQFLLCLGICSSNCSQKAQSMQKLLTFWQIQDGGRHHLEFFKFHTLDEIFPFLLSLCIYSSNCRQMAQSMQKSLTFWWIQDGGRRHLGFSKYCTCDEIL